MGASVSDHVKHPGRILMSYTVTEGRPTVPVAYGVRLGETLTYAGTEHPTQTALLDAARNRGREAFDADDVCQVLGLSRQ